MEPGNGWFQKKSALPGIHLIAVSGSILVFGGA